jgi:hypothetical protein
MYIYSLIPAFVITVPVLVIRKLIDRTGTLINKYSYFISLPKKSEKLMQIFAKIVCGWRDNSYICRHITNLKQWLS